MTAVETIFSKHGLALFDVDELPTHGGSLRIYACHAEDGSRPIEHTVNELLDREEALGFTDLEHYAAFSEQVDATKRGLLKFLIQARSEGKHIVGYGAPAKGNTLLNYCGVRTDFLDYTVDRSPHKQGTYLPGTRIPVHAPEKIFETKPDYVLILPWNIKDEVIEQMEWNSRLGREVRHSHSRSGAGVTPPLGKSRARWPLVPGLRACRCPARVHRGKSPPRCTSLP